MTLVVARIQGDRIAIASDTLLTEHQHPLPIQRGVIKSCMLPGDICVSYANSPELAERDFEKFVRAFPGGTGFSTVVSFFESSSRDTGNDYIVAFSHNPKLVTIVDGKRNRSQANTHWIGDKDAYARFRDYESKTRLGKENGRALYTVLFADELANSPASDLYSVMRHVVSDTDVASAGGFVCVISNRDPGFRYSVYSDMLYNWPEDATDEYTPKLTDKINLGASGENTEFVISQFSTRYLGLNMVAFYLLRGRKLFLFSGSGYGPALTCTVFSNVEPKEIPAKLTEATGADLHWRATVTSSLAEESNTIRRRESTEESADAGMQIEFFCHLNTFPPPGTKDDAPKLSMRLADYAATKSFASSIGRSTS